MVDLHASDKNTCRKGSDGKVKSLMDRTPSFLKSKFLSVLGSSNDLINNVLTTKVRVILSYCILFSVCFVLNVMCDCLHWFQLDISANMSSSSESHSHDHDSNENSAKQTDEGKVNIFK